MDRSSPWHGPIGQAVNFGTVKGSSAQVVGQKFLLMVMAVTTAYMGVTTPWVNKLLLVSALFTTLCVCRWWRQGKKNSQWQNWNSVLIGWKSNKFLSAFACSGLCSDVKSAQVECTSVQTYLYLLEEYYHSELMCRPTCTCLNSTIIVKWCRVLSSRNTFCCQECRMVMTSVSGHLLSLDFILAYKNWSVVLPCS